MPDSKGRFKPNTVSHFKRASNHNWLSVWKFSSTLFHISKEHQITTTSARPSLGANCFTFQKSIKSQHDFQILFRELDCFTFQKSIKSQQSSPTIYTPLYCFTFQKSIKSQLRNAVRIRADTVSHFKRASNHNE